MFFGKVGRFTDVLSEIEKRHFAGLERLHQLPVAHANDASGEILRMPVVVRIMPKQRVAFQFRFAGQHLRQVGAIHVLVRPQGLPDCRQNRRVKIRAGDRDARRGARFSAARPLDDRRHAQAAFVVRSLVGPERRVAGRTGKPAIVTGKNDQRIFVQPKLAEHPCHAADTVVHTLDHRGVGRLALPLGFGNRLVFGDLFRLTLQRRVNGVMR